MFPCELHLSEGLEGLMFTVVVFVSVFLLLFAFVFVFVFVFVFSSTFTFPFDLHQCLGRLGWADVQLLQHFRAIWAIMTLQLFFRIFFSFCN